MVKLFDSHDLILYSFVGFREAPPRIYHHPELDQGHAAEEAGPQQAGLGARRPAQHSDRQGWHYQLG